ncbi:MAG: amidase [Deltaproteobacteria bacterium]|nr:amidase [Deltaproteobacteria bacterium]MBW2382922.1 amidase [Deltaproteobacteria bacterium]
MDPAEIHWLGLTEVAEHIRRRALSSVEVTEATLARVERLDPGLHSFASLLPESAMESARAADREIARGEIRGALHGVPLAVKDLCAMMGVRTACGTPVMANRIPDHTASVVERLQAAGAVIVGKLQLTEGAYGWHHPDVTPPKNPWSADHWTGVSSSGSGVATATGLCFGSLGTDTGGSIRFPSACCNVTGLKPTYGRVSRFGVFPLAHSLDHIGPMARSAADVAALLGVLAGHDPRDETCLRAPVPDYTAALVGDLRGLSVGIDEVYVSRGIDPGVTQVTIAALERLRALGAEVREVSLPPVGPLLAGWGPFTAVECSIAHSETFPSRADEYGPQLRELLELAPNISGADYARIEMARQRYSDRLRQVFEAVDLIVMPALPVPPPKLLGPLPGQAQPAETIDNLLQFTAPTDFSGSPTLTLPGGFSDDGLPIGFQLVGRDLDEATLCRAGHAYQSATDWHNRRPPLD